MHAKTPSVPRTMARLVFLIAALAACRGATVQAPGLASARSPEPVRDAAASSPPPPVAAPAPPITLRDCDPAAPEPVVSTEAEALMAESDAAYAAGDRRMLMERLGAAAELGVARAHYNLAVLHGQEGRYAESLGRLRSALDIAPCYAAARVELARLFLEGWGVRRDLGFGLRLLADTAAMAPEGSLGRAAAQTNLATHRLYGLGFAPSVEAARSLLAKAAPHFPPAAELLAQLPEDPSVWEAVRLDPPRPIPQMATLERREDGGWERPPWTVAPGAGRRFSTRNAPARRWTATMPVAVGAPGDDHPEGPAGAETFTSCLETYRCNGNRRCMRILTVHTNRSTCHFEGELDRLSGGEAVVVKTRGIGRAITVDEATGEQASLDCQLRVRLGETAVIEEDWPPGCARADCGYRGDPRTVAFSRAFDGPSCTEVAEALAARLIAPELAQRPEWTLPGPGRPRAARWELPHSMPMVDDAAVDVVDTLTIDPAGQARVETWTVNDHSCFLEGRARRNADGGLIVVADEPSMLWVYAARTLTEGPPCTLQLREARDTLEVTGVWPEGCGLGYCGARAGFRGARFRRAR